MTAFLTIRRVLATLIATAGLVAGTNVGADAVRPQLAQRVVLPEPTTATVTEAQLGADSAVAVVTRGDFDERDAPQLERSLEVITPDGVRNPVYSVELKESPHGWYRGDFLLADWRPELHTALLRVSLGADGDKLVSYDVTTGATREVVAPRRASSVALDPDGSGLLMTTYPRARRPGRVATLSWTGVKTWLPARADGGAITSIDGTTLVTLVGERQKWWVTDLATRTSTTIDTPGMCWPHRWADADSVVATCSNRRGSQLRQVDLDGTSKRLGIRHRTSRPGPVFNDDDVRVVQGRSFFESHGGCGGGFLTRQTSSGKVRMVRVPGRRGPLSLIGTRGDSLVLAHEKNECASTRSRGALTLFDPVAGVETELTRLARNESWREIFLATEVRAWVW